MYCFFTSYVQINYLSYVVLVVDLKVIKAAVEVVVDKFLPPRFQLLEDNQVRHGPKSRIDAEIGPDGEVVVDEAEEVINPFLFKKVCFGGRRRSLQPP